MRLLFTKEIKFPFRNQTKKVMEISNFGFDTMELLLNVKF